MFLLAIAFGVVVQCLGMVWAMKWLDENSGESHPGVFFSMVASIFWPLVWVASFMVVQ